MASDFVFGPKDNTKVSVGNITVEKLHAFDLLRFINLRKNIDRDSKYTVTSGENGKGSSFFRILFRVLLNRNLKTIVIKDGKKLVGYVSLVFPKFRKLKGNTYLTISIEGGYRGMGLGTRLMQAAEEYAIENNSRRIELEVFSKNPAHKLYRRLGYEEEGRKRKAVEDEGEFDDIIFMAKLLD